MDESDLQSIPLFESLPRDDRRLIAQHADEIDVAEGTDLVRQGEFAYEFFVIEQGGAEVLRDGDHIADLGPGDFLGEMGIVEQGGTQRDGHNDGRLEGHGHDRAGVPLGREDQPRRREPDPGRRRGTLPVPRSLGGMGRRSRRRGQRESAPASTTEYRDAEGNVLALRDELSAGTLRQLEQLDAKPAASAEDRWQRRAELLFERLAVSWEISGLPLTSQKELLGRYRMASGDERRWVRETLAEHLAGRHPDVTV